MIEASRTMLNSVSLPKQFWGEVVNTACYTQNRSIIVKRHGKIAYDVFRGRSPDTSYFYVFVCLVHIHNHRDHLRKFDVKADDGFFLGYSLVDKAFRVFNIRRQEMEETYHVTFNDDDEAISKSNTEVDDATKTITFLLSNFDKPLSFTHDDFISAIGLNYIETYVSMPKKETVRAGLATLGLLDEDKPSISSTTLHVTQPKAKTNKKSRNKKISFSTQQKTLQVIRESSAPTQVADTQHAKDPVATADTTQSLDASESTEEQGNQPKTNDATKGNRLGRLDHGLTEF
ncbi:retrovirus-related pol polyprotein from transposon TNT 1-94 [Tanacetum coccineum]